MAVPMKSSDCLLLTARFTLHPCIWRQLFLRNFVELLPDYTASDPMRLNSTLQDVPKKPIWEISSKVVQVLILLSFI